MVYIHPEECAGKIGVIGTDTPFVAARPPRK
jgi:hypothetical protein